jgi:hypothetical protein
MAIQNYIVRVVAIVAYFWICFGTEMVVQAPGSIVLSFYKLKTVSFKVTKQLSADSILFINLVKIICRHSLVM